MNYSSLVFLSDVSKYLCLYSNTKPLEPVFGDYCLLLSLLSLDKYNANLKCPVIRISLYYRNGQILHNFVTRRKIIYVFGSKLMWKYFLSISFCNVQKPSCRSIRFQKAY
jgi:hypothetical protein